MFTVRIHGRGGQGVVTAADVLSVAAFDEGKYSLAFPTFGSGRTGAPVVSFCRIDESPIGSHEPIDRPDALIISDPTLLSQVKAVEGVGSDSYILVNTTHSLDELGLVDHASGLHPGRVVSVPATDLAREHLGRPLPNAALLGGFAALTGVVSVASILCAIHQRFQGPVGAANAAAAKAAFDLVRDARGSVAHA
jgi:pyruvate ferredoxin oxidoreductase gamma subunit